MRVAIQEKENNRLPSKKSEKSEKCYKTMDKFTKHRFGYAMQTISKCLGCLIHWISCGYFARDLNNTECIVTISSVI